MLRLRLRSLVRRSITRSRSCFGSDLTCGNILQIIPSGKLGVGVEQFLAGNLLHEPRIAKEEESVIPHHLFLQHAPENLQFGHALSGVRLCPSRFQFEIR